MGKIITVPFQRSRLPRRLLKDGWWLEARPARDVLIVLPLRRRPKPDRRADHLTLVTSRK